MKKIILILIMMLSLFSCSSHNKLTVFLGNNMYSYTSYLKENNNNINDTFSMQKGYISYLYSMVAQDGSDLISNKKISSIIKKSNRIIIQIGNEEVLRCLEKENDVYIINDSFFQTQKELYSYYYFLLLEEIRNIYNGEIIILSPYLEIEDYFLLGNIDEVLSSFYDIAQEVSVYFSCLFIDIRSISLFVENNTITQNGYEHLNKVIESGIR